MISPIALIAIGVGVVVVIVLVTGLVLASRNDDDE
jgi:hypothetical protein